VLERVKTMRRFSWLLLSQNAQVKDLHDGIITIGFASTGAAKNFRTSGADEILHQALIDELGVDWRVEGVIEGPGETGGGRAPVGGSSLAPVTSEGSASAGSAGSSTATTSAQSPGATSASAKGPSGTAESAPPADVPQATERSSTTAPSAEAPPDGAEPEHTSEAPRRTPPDVGAAKRAIRPTRVGASPKDSRADEQVEVSDDDAIVDDASLSSHDLLARELGAEVIEDIRDDVS
jgi:DNA polymerase III subunit gamma/tau